MNKVTLSLAMLLAVVGTSPGILAFDPADVVDVTVCDLVERPLEFTNKHVRVRGTVHDGPEFSVVIADACPSNGTTSGNIWLEQPGYDEILMYDRGWSAQKFIQAVKSGQLKGEGPPVVWQIPVPLTPLDQKQMKAVHRVVKKNPHRGVQVVITGRFDFAGDGLLIKSGHAGFEFKAAFGHLNCCSQRIVLEHIELASVAK
jgi:hypothetical protein